MIPFELLNIGRIMDDASIFDFNLSLNGVSTMLGKDHIAKYRFWT